MTETTARPVRGSQVVAPMIPVLIAFVLALFGLRSVSSVRQVEFLRPLAVAASEQSGLDNANLLMALVNYESKGNPSAVSSAGAIGLTQVKLAAATDAAKILNRPAPNSVDLLDSSTNLLFGATYLKSLIDRYDGFVDVGLAAYFKGPGWVGSIGGVEGVRRWLRTTNEVTLYVSRILDLSERLRIRSTG